MDTIQSIEIVKLNVGGTIYTTTKTTLTKQESLLSKMFSGKMKPGSIDENGVVFIDRNPKAFFYVLEFLRHGQKFTPNESSEVTPEEIDAEFSFFFHLEKEVETPRKKQKKKGSAFEEDVWFKTFASTINTLIPKTTLENPTIYVTVDDWTGISWSKLEIAIESPSEQKTEVVFYRGSKSHIDVVSLVNCLTTKKTREQAEECLTEQLKLKKVVILPPIKKKRSKNYEYPDLYVQIKCQKNKDDE